MRKPLWCGGVLVLVLVAPLRAEPPAPKVVKETWDAAYLESAKCGYVHTTVVEIERDGQKVLRTTLAMNLQIKRYKETVRLRMDTGTDETPGKLVLTGTVEGDSIVVRSANDRAGKAVPWDDKVLGLARIESLFADKKVKPGDKLEYLNFEPSLLATVKVRAVIKPPEEVDVLEAVKDGAATRVERVKKSLVRVEATSDKVMVGDSAIQLPRLVSWLSKDLQTVRSQMELPGLGQLTLYRTTQKVAEQEGVAPALLPDLGLNTLIKLDRTIPHVHEAKAVTYRITVKGTRAKRLRRSRTTPST